MIRATRAQAMVVLPPGRSWRVYREVASPSRRSARSTAPNTAVSISLAKSAATFLATQLLFSFLGVWSEDLRTSYATSDKLVEIVPSDFFDPARKAINMNRLLWPQTYSQLPPFEQYVNY
jgi:hypothetical protein